MAAKSWRVHSFGEKMSTAAERHCACLEVGFLFELDAFGGKYLFLTKINAFFLGQSPLGTKDPLFQIIHDRLFHEKRYLCEVWWLHSHEIGCM